MNLKKQNNFLHFMIHDLRLSMKLTILMIFLIAITVLSVSMLFQSKFDSLLSQEMENSSKQLVNQYIEDINYKFKFHENVLRGIVINDYVQEVINTGNDDSMEVISATVAEEINEVLFNKIPDDVYDITLYDADEAFISDNKYLDSLSHVKEEEWVQTFYQKQYFYEYFFHSTGEMGFTQLSILFPIQNYKSKESNTVNGVLKVDLFPDRIFKSTITDMDSDERKTFFVIDQDGQIVYSNNNSKIPYTQDILNQYYQIGLTRIDDPNKNHAGFYQISEDFAQNFKVVFFFSDREIHSRTTELVRFILTSMSLVILLLIFIAIQLSSTFTRRIQLLVDKMNDVKEGNIELLDTVEGYDEIGEMGQHFNDMIRRIQQLIDENYIQKLEKQEAEFKALQSQINPHFIFNTLETINATAYIGGCTDTAEISTRLGQILRYSIGSQQAFVALESELKNVIDYIEIQKYRFGDQFTFRRNIHPKYLKTSMLKLTLQPLVENAILHGFKDFRGEGIIDITAVEEDLALTIIVSDNGVGMDQETCKNLNEYLNRKEYKIHQEKRRSIGLQNVHKRLQIAFGNAYGIRIVSEKDRGTKVILKVPK
mgnify:FL=1